MKRSELKSEDQQLAMFWMEKDPRIDGPAANHRRVENRKSVGSKISPEQKEPTEEQILEKVRGIVNSNCRQDHIPLGNCSGCVRKRQAILAIIPKGTIPEYYVNKLNIPE